ncbi:ATP-binding protein [Streptomyces longwoodensis]|uniref:ATP-binding protein n=1 Tax=Streptomyces longwoodensis TaxID=68231 RepID=UPI00384F6333
MEPVPVSVDAPDEQAMQTTMALEGNGASIAQARHLAARFLTQAQAAHELPVSQRAVDLTQLVVSELVTNAHKHAPGLALMQLRIVGDLVEIMVWDSASQLPVARTGDAGRVGRHGLEIVKAVAQDYAVQMEPVGKRVTVRIALLDDPGGAVTGRSSF